MGGQKLAKFVNVVCERSLITILKFRSSLWEARKKRGSTVLDYALQVETYYLIYQVLCSIKALEFCRRGPYYVTACQLFDFSDQLQFDAQLNKLFVQNFHCNSFFFIGCYTNMNYV